MQYQNLMCTFLLLSLDVLIFVPPALSHLVCILAFLNFASSVSFFYLLVAQSLSNRKWTYPYWNMAIIIVIIPTIFKKRKLNYITYFVVSEAWLCGLSHAGIVGSNPARGMRVCLLWTLRFFRGLCVEPISRPEESYRVVCPVSDREAPEGEAMTQNRVEVQQKKYIPLYWRNCESDIRGFVFRL